MTKKVIFGVLFIFLLLLVFPGNQVLAEEWEKITPSFNPDGNYQLRYGTFLNENLGWATSISNEIWKSTDGGYHWDMQKNNIDASIAGIKFLDSLSGWVSCYNGHDQIPHLLRTIDGGSSWEKIDFPDTAFAGPFSMHFIDSLEGLVGGWNNEFYYTVNGGKTWQDLTGGEMLFGCIYDFYFLDSLHGWGVGESGEAIDAGVMIKTDDGGRNWNILLPMTYRFHAVCFNNLLHGCAVGFNMYYSGTIMLTKDGGETWKDIQVISTPLNDIIFTSDRIGWTIGYDGYIFHTSDSGETWNPVESGTQNDLRCIEFVENNSIGYIFGDSTLLKYGGSGSSIGDVDIPSQFTLYPNYPNPFNAQTIIEFEMNYTDDVALTIHDLNGKRISNLINNKSYSAGKHRIIWNGKDQYGNEAGSGIYFYELRTGTQKQVRKMVLLR